MAEQLHLTLHIPSNRITKRARREGEHLGSGGLITKYEDEIQGFPSLVQSTRGVRLSMENREYHNVTNDV